MFGASRLSDLVNSSLIIENCLSLNDAETSTMNTTRSAIERLPKNPMPPPPLPPIPIPSPAPNASPRPISNSSVSSIAGTDISDGAVVETTIAFAMLGAEGFGLVAVANCFGLITIGASTSEDSTISSGGSSLIVCKTMKVSSRKISAWISTAIPIAEPLAIPSSCCAPGCRVVSGD